ncbi:MAG: T9SS type A sorting domain-containing protein [Bacteroidales bacterium]|nr:T9SS type A sorting domain-containing protein [Bacteroidales bacterium]
MKRLQNVIIGMSLIVFGINEYSLAQTVTIDMNTEYQLIKGFGGIQIPAWTGTELTEDMCEKAFGNDPGKIGLSMLRLRIDPDSNNFYRELPMAKYAVSKGATVFASPWNPPVYMRDTVYSGVRLLPDFYDKYVEHLNQYNKFMADSGISLYAISVQNEPDIGESWADWTATEIYNFVRDYAQDMDTRVMAPESFNFKHSYSDNILNDSTANSHLDIIGGHIYGGGLVDYPLARSKGKEVWMTEHLTGSDSVAQNTWSLALDMGTEINDCMKANFNAYTWWYIRRFYSFINDEGNITQKGYVMSQFSKFIRPGAVRVDAVVASAPNVDVTAYKTDTTLAIVVINKNSTSVDLGFTIQNGSTDTLTKYSSSATKTVTNDGGISITGGVFNATVDASSITTFINCTENAGKYGNIAPFANAGNDTVLTDIDGNSTEVFILSGSGSYDPDGEIANFSWSLNGVQIASEADPEVEVEVGESRFVLTVTDNDGARHYDSITISVISPYTNHIWLEAECVRVGSHWNILKDALASQGEYITVPAGVQSLNAASADTSDHAVFNFYVIEQGSYKVWGRAITPTYDDDSYWVKVDTGTWSRWNGIAASVGSEWGWDDVHDDIGVLQYELDTGFHTLTICYREDGAKLDKIYLTNTGNQPTDMGDTATNCPDEPVNIKNIYLKNQSVMVFPNPATNRIQVYWDDRINEVTVLSSDGRIMLMKQPLIPDYYADIDLNLGTGMYFIVVRNKKTFGVTKLIVK